MGSEKTGQRRPAVALAALLLWAFPVAHAQEISAPRQPNSDDIAKALSSAPRTRGIRPSPDQFGSDQRRFIEELRTRSARSITIEERAKVAEIAEKKPKIDLEIHFEFNSAELRPQAVPVLLALGRAVSRDEFKGAVFLINGHTDAKGGTEYNQDLSERRAETVKRLLIEQFGMPSGSLIAVGYGKTRLKNAADPLAGENRRVQVVNTGGV